MAGTLDLEALKTKDRLTAQDEELIAAEALREIKGAKEKQPEDAPKPDEEKAEEPKEEVKEPEKETKEPSEEEKAKAEEDAKAEEKRLLEAEEKDLTEEDKVKKAELVKKQDEDKKKAFEDEVNSYAKESNLPVEEARKDLESISGIQEKYKNDPKQLAKANLHLQRLYTKTQEEAKALKEAKPPEPPLEISDESVNKLITEGKITINGKKATKEEIIEAYRLKEDEITKTIEDDEVVYRMAVKDLKSALEMQRKDNLLRLSGEAKEKKAKLISEMSEEDKQYLPEIKPLLDKLSDAYVMDASFGLGDYVLWAKGKKYDEDIKSAYEKGKQKGIEEGKILGTPAKPKEGNAPTKTKKTRTLTDEEKTRALDMFDSPSFKTDQERFDAYLEYLKDTGQEK